MFTKKSKPREYIIQKKLAKSFPGYVPRAHEYKNGTIYMDKVRGPTLYKYIQTASDASVIRIIGQVLGLLKKITTKFPRFRHNDLHLKNIMIEKGHPVMIDFGLAGSTVRNREYGLSKATKPIYDIHYFLNSVFTQVCKNPALYKKSYSWLLKALPVGYRGANTAHVKNYRLRL